MVSKASEDLPDPDNPVITVTVFRGISKLMFLRLCWRAPRTMIFVSPIVREPPPLWLWQPSGDTEARVTLQHSKGGFPGQVVERSEPIKKVLGCEFAARTGRFYLPPRLAQLYFSTG